VCVCVCVCVCARARVRAGTGGRACFELHHKFSDVHWWVMGCTASEGAGTGGFLIRGASDSSRGGGV